MTALGRLDARCDDLPGFKGQRLRARDWASNRGRTFTPNIAAAGVRPRGPAGPANHPAYAFDVHRNSPALLRARTPPACNDAAPQRHGWFINLTLLIRLAREPGTDSQNVFARLIVMNAVPATGDVKPLDGSADWRAFSIRRPRPAARVGCGEHHRARGISFRRAAPSSL